MGTMLYAVALTLQTVMGLNQTQYVWTLIGLGVFATLYTAVGGLKAVIWTDALQAIVLGSAVLIIFYLAIDRIDGGWQAFWQISSDNDKFQMVHLRSNLLEPENFTAANSLFTAAAFGLFMYLPGYAVAQNMIQRYVCTDSLAGARGVVALSAVVNAGLGLLFLLVGTALFVFYQQPGGLGLPAIAAEIAKEDQILPYFVTTQLGAVSGLLGLLLAGLFAASMSTIDSGINGVTSVIVYDWLAGRDLALSVSRMLTLFLGTTVIIAALLAPRLGDTVIGIINTIAGTCLGMILAVFLLGMLIPRSNQNGVLIGLGAGLSSVVSAWALLDIPNWWLGAFAIVPTFIVALLASYFFSRPNRQALTGTIYRKFAQIQTPD
jgi:Na+/proline symporter